MTATKNFIPKIFYSWQSTKDREVCFNIQEQAIRAALKILKRHYELDSSYDRDTLGVAGTPHIVETILAKIEMCDVFIADLTLSSKKPPNINTNVALELGYAMRDLRGVFGSGGDRIIQIMNTAFGPPDKLPFDFKHRRWPIQYHLPSNSSPEQITKVRKKLIDDLAFNIKGVLETFGPRTSNKHKPMPVSSNRFMFIDETKPLFWTPKDFMTNGKDVFLSPNGLNDKFSLHQTISSEKIKK